MRKALSFHWVICFTLFVFPAFGAERWRTVADIPAVLPTAEATVINQQIYVLSGSVGHGLRHFFEVYDPVDDGWRPLTPLPADISDFAVTNIGGRMMVVGGRDRQTGDVSDAVWLYVPFAAVWVELPPLPQAMINHAIISLNDTVYLAGNNKMWRMVGAQGSWSEVGDLPLKDAAVRMVSDGTDLFLVGGEPQPAIWRYHVAAKKWSRLPALASAAAGGSLVVLGAQSDPQLHYLGGYDVQAQKASPGHYVLKNGKWLKALDLPQGRHRMATAVLDDKLYVIGGAAGDGFFRFFTGSDQLYVYSASDE